MIVERDATVRAYRPGDERQIQEAFEQVFRTRRRLDDWRWKFAHAPRGSRIMLAFDPDGRLLCQYAAIELAVRCFGRDLVAGQIVDVFSRSRAGLGRTGGPFLRTVREFLEAQRGADGLAFIYGFPGERHQRLGELGGLYHRTAPIERLRRDLAGSSRRQARRPLLAEGYDATAIDRLWAVAAPRYPAAVVRDARWFAWRYAARPRAEYVQIGLRRGGRARAWAVLAVAGERASWVDLVWDGDLPDDLLDLAEEVGSRAVALGARSLELWAAGDGAARGVLIDAGFEAAADPERRLSAIVFDPRIELERLLASLYLTLGDSDHV